MNDRNYSPLVLFLQTVVLFMSQLLDYGTTLIGLKLGGQESNGLVATIMEEYGNTGFLWFKLLVAGALAIVCRYRPAAAWFITAITCGVALWNLHVIYQLG